MTKYNNPPYTVSPCKGDFVIAARLPENVISADSGALMCGYQTESFFPVILS